jgi:hypothetical protein
LFVVPSFHCAFFISLWVASLFPFFIAPMFRCSLTTSSNTFLIYCYYFVPLHLVIFFVQISIFPLPISFASVEV